jgi:hypothetical protein
VGFFGVLHCVQDDGKYKGNDKDKGFGPISVYFPPFAKDAKDGAPRRLTTATATAQIQQRQPHDNSSDNSRSPSGMTTRKATATATAIRLRI